MSRVPVIFLASLVLAFALGWFARDLGLGSPLDDGTCAPDSEREAASEAFTDSSLTPELGSGREHDAATGESPVAPRLQPSDARSAGARGAPHSAASPRVVLERLVGSAEPSEVSAARALVDDWADKAGLPDWKRHVLLAELAYREKDWREHRAEAELVIASESAPETVRAEHAASIALAYRLENRLEDALRALREVHRLFHDSEDPMVQHVVKSAADEVKRLDPQER